VREAAPKNPDNAYLMQTALIQDFFECRFDLILPLTEKALKNPNISVPDSLIAHAARAIIFFLQNDKKNFEEALTLAGPITTNPEINSKKTSSIGKALAIYISYLQLITKFQSENPSFYEGNAAKEIYLIGDSHSLSPANCIVSLGGENYRFRSELIMGTKAYALSTKSRHPVKNALTKAVKSVPEGAKIILCFGEIDCRIQEGIFSFWQKNKSASLDDIINETVNNYADYVKTLLEGKDHLICGVPAPSLQTLAKHTLGRMLNAENTPQYLDVVKKFNQRLKEVFGSNFIDIYQFTLGEKGTAKPDMHLDEAHLKPNILPEALKAKV
jgi:hypothetical protein